MSSKDYFQLRIPRDLKEFFDKHVEEERPLGIMSGNDMMRYILIKKAQEIQNTDRPAQEASTDEENSE